MSRIGRLPLRIPAGVTVAITETEIRVAGPRGELRQFSRPEVSITPTAEEIRVANVRNDRASRALHGLYRQLIQNMLTGVTSGFIKTLEMKGTGYRAEIQGNDLVLSVGFSHPVRIPTPSGITFKVEKNVLITIEGSDKQMVGEVAAKIRRVRPPEPYKGKGIRYSGEQIRLKPGKAAAKTTA